MSDPKITFRRILRDCNWNRDCEPRRRIYDVAIFVDGERRATFCRSYGRGYFLRDEGGLPVRTQEGLSPSRRCTVEARGRGDIETVFRAALNDGHVPTLAQITEREAAAERRRNEQEAAEEAERKAELVRAAGADLLDAVLIALPFVEGEEQNPAYKRGFVKKCAAQMRAAIAKAEGKAA